MNKSSIETGKHRRARGFIRRKSAAELAADTVRRPQHPGHSNQDNDVYDQKPMAFSKGLAHDATGKPDQAALVTLLEQTAYSTNSVPEVKTHITAETAAKKGVSVRCSLKNPDQARADFRVWESPLAGHYYTLEGPDPDAVSLAPAPSLGSAELCAELAEVYAMAITRDMRFDEINDPDAEIYRLDPVDQRKVAFVIDSRPAVMRDLTYALDGLSYFSANPGPRKRGDTLSAADESGRRRRTARVNDAGDVTAAELFRGSSPGCFDGDFVSQFLLIGGGGSAKSGKIPFGAQEINQRLLAVRGGLDYLTSFPEWLDVQNGVNLSGLDVFEETDGNRRSKFLETPRDMATYVHIDQLYQAYFNACLLMLGNGVKPDVGFPNSDVHPNNHGTPPSDNSQTRTGFATFGGPHVLSLMTEVASRGLRAVRRQKFQIHRRARPERLAALITLAANDEWGAIGNARPQIEAMLQELGLGAETRPMTTLMGWINELNGAQNAQAVQDIRQYECTANKDDFAPSGDQNFLLPMAFPEGSPMHPAYGAGHATVAGACVTILKAFFQLHGLNSDGSTSDPDAPLPYAQTFGPSLKPAPGGDTLEDSNTTATLSLEGELNKLAANISIGRNMAGVHYYSDYYDSLRLGERVAFAIVQEQMLTYNEPVRLTFHSFDGDWIEIATSGGSNATDVTVTITDVNGIDVPEAEWWTRAVADASVLS